MTRATLSATWTCLRTTSRVTRKVLWLCTWTNCPASECTAGARACEILTTDCSTLNISTTRLADWLKPFRHAEHPENLKLLKLKKREAKFGCLRSSSESQDRRPLNNTLVLTQDPDRMSNYSVKAVVL